MFKRILFILIFLSFSSSLLATTPGEFLSPPDSARPWVYWFIMDGNLTREGITADFEAMKEQGIGGAILMEVNVGVPRGNVDFMSEEWQRLFAHIVRETERLGLQLTLSSGPGWAGSGGPWITLEKSMWHLVASEKTVQGPAMFNEALPVPQPRIPFFGEGQLPPNIEKARKEFFKDVRVLAFPTPKGSTRTADIDEKALYVRAPYSSAPGVKPRMPAPAVFPDVPAEDLVTQSQIIDLTNRLDASGVLQWNVPAGEWTILRLAATSTGANTRPAPAPGFGLESSKMDRAAFDIHAENFMFKLFQAVGECQMDGKAGWCFFHIDSWEMGPQNYSDSFFAEFKKRRGYDPILFLPCYLGFIVESAEKTERFLWDVRQTSQELILENHGEYLREIAHKNGLKLSLEPYDMMPCCDMTFGAIADIPMCEFWTGPFDTVFSCFEAASVAHTNAKQIVAAEAFTNCIRDAWRHNPKTMKQLGDWAFCSGINRFVFHRYQHQPYLDRYPGFSMGDIGIHWERTQTWWPLISGYHRYLARCQHVLQQGTAVVDVLYLLPEGAPQVFTPPESALIISGTIRDQRGYRFDGCDPVTLLKLATVKDGEIAFPNGTSYKILVLPNVETMTLPMLEKIESLVRQGATVVGNAPKQSPSLQNYPQVDRDIQALAEKMWGKVPNKKNVISYGKGSIITLSSISDSNDAIYPEYDVTAKILTERGIDVDFDGTEKNLRFFHRCDRQTDFYFVGNRTNEPFHGEVSFRVTGKQTSIWDPLTGQIFKTPPAKTGIATTSFVLDLEGSQSVFVVFDDKGAPPQSFVWQKVSQDVVLEITDDWEVRFDSKRGGPETSVRLPKLIDWTRSEMDGIKYYSGIATYRKTFTISDIPSGKRHWLDLGDVEVMAKVALNGKNIGTRWMAPYTLDVTDTLQRGENVLEIEVANLWVNRLVGDAKLPAEKRMTWTTLNNAYSADAPLLPSGLIGPVRIFGGK